MSAGPTRLPPRFALLCLLAGPLVVAVWALALARAPTYRLDSAAEMAARERGLEQQVARLFEDAAATAQDALARSPAAAFAARDTDPLGARLEGVARLGSALEFLDWDGVPAEPPMDFGEPGSSAWHIRSDGARTRLLARAGPDAEGRLGLACFVIDATADELSFRQLLPATLLHGLQLEVRFAGDEDDLFGAAGGAGSPRARLLRLRAPDDSVIGIALLEPVAPEWMRAQLAAAARAWATALFVAALALLVRWERLVQTRWGLAATWAALIACRGLAAAQQVPARTLPRELGSPDLYGSTAAAGLLASPADLLLTALATYLAARALCRHCRDRSSRAAWASLALGGALASTAAAWIAVSIARNTRPPLLGRPAPFVWDGRLALWIALLLVLFAAAECWAACGARLRPRARAAAPRRVLVALVVVVLVCPTLGLLERETRRLDLEHLAHDFVPQLLEQHSFRRVALTATLRAFAADDRMVDRIAHDREAISDFDAYEAWVSSELCQAGLESSIDVYGADGTHWSHFGFDLPPLEETVETEILAGSISVREEAFRVGIAEDRRVLHGESAVALGDELVAVIVAHVVDEPDNLSFLPWNRPYLAALVPGSTADAAPAQGPDYVLYDGDSVVLTTLRQTPAAAEVRRAAQAGSLRLSAGDSSYLGVSVDEGPRMHLLLARQRGGIEQLATAVRLSLLGLGLLAVLLAVQYLGRPAWLGELPGLLRGSFQRKLVAALLVAAVPPLIGLALFLRSYVEGRSRAELAQAARQYVAAAQQVVEDLAAEPAEDDGESPAAPDDVLLHWLRSVVGQEIHVYRDGLLEASSKRELFSSGLVAPRLDGRVQRRLGAEGLPSLVLPSQLGPITLPVAYAPVRRSGWTDRVVAVPIAVEQEEIAGEAAQVSEMILLATVLLVALLAVAARLLARTVARPLRELADATGRLAAGRGALRLEPRGQDEVAGLFRAFNAMAQALAEQRDDLERRREYIETLLAHATTGVVSLDPAGDIVTLNPAAERLLAAPDTRLSRGTRLAAALERSPRLRPLAAALAPERSPTGSAVDVDLTGDRHQARRIRLVRVELRDGAGGSVGTMILLDDVTDLMRSNQLAAWAEMARAIAHEIKNPLTPIQLSTEHLRRLLRDRGLAPSAEEQACLETILKQVRALYSIAGEFSAYAKLPDLTPAPTDPVAFMRDVVGPYRSGHPPGVRIEESYEPAPPVRIDSRVLSRAVINLIENALQAMERGGTLRLAVRRADADGVVLSVADTGPGLAPAVRQRLFEPYFSTKSSGTGLGLAIVRRAVEAHRGEIRVESPPGGGTTFSIHLPAFGAGESVPVY